MKNAEQMEITNEDSILLHKNEEEKKTKNPLYWFGSSVFVDPNLKVAQKHFEMSTLLSVKILNLNNQIRQLQDQITKLNELDI